MFYNEDSLTGSARIADDSVDLVITDPPFAIEGDTLHRHYNRKEGYVVDGYVEVAAEDYSSFTIQWLEQARRVLKKDGSLYIVSGWSNLRDVLVGIEQVGFELINHIVWKYNFGVHTKRKYVTSHYHILYCGLPGGRPQFNREARFSAHERTKEGGSLLYRDLEDVWIINREYKPGRRKNKNELPSALLEKMILYSSSPGDLVMDLFAGSFSTCRTALALGRKAIGFELNENAYQMAMEDLSTIEVGSKLESGERAPNPYFNQGKPWTEGEITEVRSRFDELRSGGSSKKDAIEVLGQEFGRGRFSLDRILKTAAI